METKKSLDELEYEAWNPGPSMLEEPASWLTARPFSSMDERDFWEAKILSFADYEKGYRVSLNGRWKMAADQDEESCVKDSAGFVGAVSANVPCSVHTALFEAGVIPDPMVGQNDRIAREYCYKEWWFEKEFADPGLRGQETLVFEGVCYRTHVWLNGKFLGSHSGMFGKFEFDISGLLEEKNRLVVKIDNAPENKKPLSDFMDNDEGWHDGVVINCVYGWHYACLPSRGIWAPVYLRRKDSPVEFEAPFVTSAAPEAGELHICLKVLSGQGAAELYGKIVPKNFEGEILYFEESRAVKAGDILHFAVKVENPRLWWPNGIGEQNLYTLTLSIKTEDKRETGWQVFNTGFAFRTIEMGSLPEGPFPDKHNWTYIVNGRKMFVKGANWCTLDALLRFPKEKYERFLTLAREENIQLLRAWGGGMPESDVFYNLCDELGIMVMQEWPTCWDSQKTQPFDELEETVRTHMVRLRNHPSLIMWCGGNESKEADGPAMDMMARLAYELDGSRCFHRTSPWGGGLHNYSSYWDMEDIDKSLQLNSPFLGEFGMASVPNRESVLCYLPKEEQGIWPPDKYGSFAHHTPRFNQFDPCDMDYLSRHAKEFAPLDTMEHFIWATQIAQATAIRHTLENYRSRWPYSTAVCFYKLTDVYPAASWSTVDYYGVPKLSYYILADSYEPCHGALLFQSTKALNGLNVPVVLLDDAGKLKGKSWTIQVEAFDRDLKRIKTCVYRGISIKNSVERAGDFTLKEEETDGRLLLLTVKLFSGDEMLHSTFYWLNYEKEQGALLNLPKTTLTFQKKSGTIIVKNKGRVPAVGVMVENVSHAREFLVSDSVFWLEPDEEREIKANILEGISVKAWNGGV